MLVVECWYLNHKAEKKKAGEIHWDGTNFIVHDTAGRNLRELIVDPVMLPGGKLLYSGEDPVRFMQMLHVEYHGSYFHCDPAYDTTGNPQV